VGRTGRGAAASVGRAIQHASEEEEEPTKKMQPEPRKAQLELECLRLFAAIRISFIILLCVKLGFAKALASSYALKPTGKRLLWIGGETIRENELRRGLSEPDRTFTVFFNNYFF
jgi:hypothetical protein